MTRRRRRSLPWLLPLARPPRPLRPRTPAEERQWELRALLEDRDRELAVVREGVMA